MSVSAREVSCGLVTALTSGTLAGMIIADEILGRDNPFAKVGPAIALLTNCSLILRAWYVYLDIEMLQHTVPN